MQNNQAVLISVNYLPYFGTSTLDLCKFCQNDLQLSGKMGRVEPRKHSFRIFSNVSYRKSRSQVSCKKCLKKFSENSQKKSCFRENF